MPRPQPPTPICHRCLPPPPCDSNLLAALRWAASGLPVFPCAPWIDANERRWTVPLIANRETGATTDPDQIREWGRRWPGAFYRPRGVTDWTLTS